MEQEILKVFNRCTSVISIIGTTITSIFGSQWILFAGYLLLNVLDYITGSIKVKVKKEESSSKGLIGIIKN